LSITNPPVDSHTFAHQKKLIIMNTIKKLATVVLAVVAMLGLQQCNNDEIEPAPVVLVDPTSASNIPGGEVSAELTIEAPNGADFLTVYVSGIEEDQIDLAGEDLSVPLVYDYTVPANAVIGSKIVLSFQVTDNEGYPSAIANFVVTVGDPVLPLQGILTTQTLVSTNPYLLKGQVFIPNGVTVTIPAGTVIKGEKATKATLIIQPGGKLIAEGTANNPVVFTSNQSVGERDRGDWGGIVMLGNAFVNQTSLPAIEGISPTQTYGNITSVTTNATENSGSLKYVRIEYAGIELTPNNETNSLTMGGVGSGTTIEYVQVSFGGDDGFEWFGGGVNGKYLVSLSTWDDDFDTDFGWGGNVQWGLVVRNPFFADQSGSNAFESDSQGNGNPIPGFCDLTAAGTGNVSGCTRGVFSNITVLGPRELNSRGISGNYDNTLHIRRRSSISIFNSFFSGFRKGLRIDDAGTWYNINNGHAVFANNVLSITPNVGVATSSTASEGTFLTGIAFTASDDGTVDTNTPPAVAAGRAASVASKWNLTNAVFNNVTTAAQIADLGITHSLYWGGQTSANYPSNPNFALVAGAAGANNLNDGEDFTNPKLTGGFFTPTTYRGAFGATDWTDGWAEFQPLNKPY
jgi:hypothetical protein